MVLKDLFTGQQWRNRCREQTYEHGERGRECEIYEESNIETYITICKIDSQLKFIVWLRKLKQGLCINLEGWDGDPGTEPPSPASSVSPALVGRFFTTSATWDAS